MTDREKIALELAKVTLHTTIDHNFRRGTISGITLAVAADMMWESFKLADKFIEASKRNE